MIFSKVTDYYEQASHQSSLDDGINGRAIAFIYRTVVNFTVFVFVSRVCPDNALLFRSCLPNAACNTRNTFNS